MKTIYLVWTAKENEIILSFRMKEKAIAWKERLEKKTNTKYFSGTFGELFNYCIENEVFIATKDGELYLTKDVLKNECHKLSIEDTAKIAIANIG